MPEASSLTLEAIFFRQLMWKLSDRSINVANGCSRRLCSAPLQQLIASEQTLTTANEPWESAAGSAWLSPPGRQCPRSFPRAEWVWSEMMGGRKRKVGPLWPQVGQPWARVPASH